LISVLNICLGADVINLQTKAGRNNNALLTRKIKNHNKKIVKKSAFVQSSPFWDMDLYGASAAGAISQSCTWSLILPLEIIKTRIQTSSKNTNLMKEAKFLFRSQVGKSILKTGLIATAFSAMCNGAVRYGLFDNFKEGFNNFCTKRNVDPDGGIRLPLLFAASSSAEVLTFGVLAPMEKIRVFIMAQRNPLGIREAVQTMVGQSGVTGLWQGFLPSLMKQIPYTAVRLSCYELMYKPIRNIISEKFDLTDQQELFHAALIAGLLAGIAGTVVSQPADVLYAKVCQGKFDGQGFGSLLSAVYSEGLRKSFVGLGPRVTMNSILTASQMIVYEIVKEFLASDNKYPKYEIAIPEEVVSKSFAE